MDNVIKSDVHYQEHTGVITHVTSQPTEGLTVKAMPTFFSCWANVKLLDMKNNKPIT